MRLDEFKGLMELVQQKFKNRSGKEIHTVKNKEQYFIALAEDIKSVAGISITPSTLYKTYHIKFTKLKNEYENVNEQNANGLSEYVDSSRYSQKYEAVPKSNKNRKVDYYGYATKPEMPEFPRDAPSFPATPTIPIILEDYDNFKIFVKDESKHALISNHKSRAAWEIYLHANKFSEEQKSNHADQTYRASILSSGNFALAIFARLEMQGVKFKLNIIVDEKVLNSDDPRLAIKKNHLEIVKKVADKYKELTVYEFDIHSRRLDSKAILDITNNPNGFDLTFLENVRDVKDSYYDWLAFEILSQSPDFVFIPFGSGDLMTNILDVLAQELPKSEGDESKRYFGKDTVLEECNFYGMTTFDNFSVFDKLYAPEAYHPSDKFMKTKGKYEKTGIKGTIDILDESDFEKGELEKYIKESKKIFDNNNIKYEMSGIAGLVLFLKMFNDDRDYFKKKKVLIINTGVGDWSMLLTDELERIRREGYSL